MMWCPNCRADVAAELSSDNRRSLCTRCGTDLELSPGREPAHPAASRDARDLLARWSAETWLEPIHEPAAAEMHPSDSAIPLLTNASLRTAARRARIEPPRTAPTSEPASPAEVSVPAPQHTAEHVGEQAPAQDPAWLALLGQLTAYLGVGGLTCGAALVLWSYFGGPSEYAPTGWLLTTIGQMLLFLGVVTLISCGLEQTAAEVRHGLARLEGHLLRLERAGASSVRPAPHPHATSPESSPVADAA